MRLNHIYVLLGLFAVVHTMPVDASGSDRLKMRSVKEQVNGVNGNSGANGAPSNSVTNGVHSNSGTNGAPSNSGTNGAHSQTNVAHSDSGTDSDPDSPYSFLSDDSSDTPIVFNPSRTQYCFLGLAGSLTTGREVIPRPPEAIMRRLDNHLGRHLSGPFVNEYILPDLRAEFEILVTENGRTHQYRIPRAEGEGES
ncbi:hypothetical protein GGU10DRAFT_49846 [Lentinula aff. detonsa]|uniref:Uncharacterized protein n=1 Tax=Lentinula aff. detonsa TaxID=2804958 RepID=A0AA38NQZ9_9AGAR|nr:hypothetical protein GGU10DRAFT_49846 [Lentinula aff. detonsa]